MNDYKEYPENMNTAENTTETEAVKQTGTVILPPAGEQKAKPAASNGDSKASFRVRTVAALCIVCSLLGGIVSTGSYALYQYYNSDSEELETTPLDPSGKQSERCQHIGFFRRKQSERRRYNQCGKCDLSRNGCCREGQPLHCRNQGYNDHKLWPLRRLRILPARAPVLFTQAMDTS